MQLKTHFCTMIALTVIPCVAAFSQSAVPSSEKFDELIERVWQFELDEDPLLATNVGDERGQDRLSDESLNAQDRRYEARVAFASELEQIAPDSLESSKQVDYELLKHRLDGQIAYHDFSLHLMPINNREGFHISFPELPRVMNPKTRSDFRNYVARLNDFPRYVDDHIALLRQGIKKGLTQPSIIMRDSVSQVTAHVVDDPNDSLLMTNLSDESHDRFSKEQWQEISDEIRHSIRENVVPSYRRFAEFLEEEYLPACRSAIGASSLPQGRELYRDRIRRFTTLDLTPESIHETGIRENKRIRAEMEAIRDQVEFDGDLPAFLKHLRTDKQFYPSSREELLKEVALILKRADGRLPELFGRLPRIPYGIREVPAYVAPQTTAAYYWPPATDGSRGGFYYINTYNLSSRPLYQLESLSLHEAVPGHHLQLALQAELDDLHPISRESNITAFIEGWALYSERLGKEIGFYKDPYQDFGRLSMEAWRASRLVVDTGIHWMGWSRPQAIQYMTENTALSEHNIVAEVDRYIGWPGQALAYKIGELAITRMRRDAESRLGEKFDVRAFHDAVLANGSVPLPLLERRIEQFIRSQP